MGAPWRKVARTSVATSSRTSSSQSGSTRSVLVSATRPPRMRRREQIARCSRVCGITPSSAAITSMARSMPPTPASMFFTKRSWPGTSTISIVSPPGSSRNANPRSIVMPRAFSSGRRSVSMPVSALTSEVLPWSMWPAVPTTTWRVMCRGGRSLERFERLCEPADLRGKHRPAVQQELVVHDPADHRRVALAQARVEPHGRLRVATHDQPRGGQLHRRQGAAAHLRAVVHDARPEALAARGREPPEQAFRAAPYRGEGFGEESECRDRLERGARLVGVQRGLEGGDRELVDPERAVPRVLLEPPDDGVPADDDAGLRATEELVAREGDEVEPRGDRLRHGRLVGEAPRAEVHERARAEVLHDGDPTLAAELHELA